MNDDFTVDINDLERCGGNFEHYVLLNYNQGRLRNENKIIINEPSNVKFHCNDYLIGYIHQKNLKAINKIAPDNLIKEKYKNKLATQSTDVGYRQELIRLKTYEYMEHVVQDIATNHPEIVQGDTELREELKAAKTQYAQFLFGSNSNIHRKNYRTMKQFICEEMPGAQVIGAAIYGRRFFPDYIHEGQGLLGMASNIYQSFREEMNESGFYEKYKHTDLKLEEMIFEVVSDTMVTNCQKIYDENKNILIKHKNKTLNEAKEIEKDNSMEK